MGRVQNVKKKSSYLPLGNVNKCISLNVKRSHELFFIPFSKVKLCPAVSLLHCSAASNKMAIFFQWVFIYWTILARRMNYLSPEFFRHPKELVYFLEAGLKQWERFFLEAAMWGTLFTCKRKQQINNVVLINYRPFAAVYYFRIYQNLPRS